MIFIYLCLYIKTKMDWYNTLNKSPLTPPVIVFRLVWPILYTLMFLSYVMVMTSTNDKITISLLFGTQLLLNLCWSFSFFKSHNVKVSLMIIGVLLINVCVMTYTFYKDHQLSAFLQFPYILWLCFAGYLNWFISKHN